MRRRSEVLAVLCLQLCWYLTSSHVTPLSLSLSFYAYNRDRRTYRAHARRLHQRVGVKEKKRVARGAFVPYAVHLSIGSREEGGRDGLSVCVGAPSLLPLCPPQLNHRLPRSVFVYLDRGRKQEGATYPI